MILKKLSIMLFGCTMLTFGSCIQEEPLNAECDIIGVDSIWLKNNQSILLGEPTINNTSVNFTIQKETDRSHLNPSFYLTEGAKITIEQNGAQVEGNGAVRDFTTPQIYTTYSEDGNWSKQYTVSFNFPRLANSFNFENFELDKSGRYYVWYELDKEDPTNPRRNDWSSGNAGFAFTGKGKVPTDYPTQINSTGYKGYGVALTTCSTGSFGGAIGMPIAAGNIFIGEFKSEKATTDPLSATRFGKLGILSGKPITLTGYYKYKAGNTFTNKKGEQVPGRKDVFDIYAVLYEAYENNKAGLKEFVPLDGRNSLTSDRIVSLARVEDPNESDIWTKFEIPFIEHKSFDIEKLKNNEYAITIVLTSSRDGAYFEGAVGSTLNIDEVKIICEE